MNTFYHGDCLFVMNHDIEPNTIDLIYLDPPFFTGKTQKGTAKWQPGAMEVSYEDSKKFWGDTEKVNAMRTKSPEWLRHIALKRPDFASYLFYMMERLEVCKKVLKDTGSIYLHCDEKASHYLKMIMDEVFGYENYRNEIIWHYHSGGATNKHWASKHDDILFYSKSERYTFNPQFEPYNAVIAKKRQHLFNPEGKMADDVFDIGMLSTVSPERTGYPTQKPLALLERIIKASSTEGNIILDPFCGCGTAIIAAQRLNRNWRGIDINKMAHEVSGNRLGELPLNFKHYQYVSRDLDEVLAIKDALEFHKWVNEYYKAIKPKPDKGVDGITPDFIPIQTKTFIVKYGILDNFLTAIKLHPAIKGKPTTAIIVSQKGFDPSATKRQFEIKATDGIDIQLLTPSIMLNSNGTSKT